MKKIIPIVIACAMLLAFASCDNADPTPSASVEPSADVVTAEPTPSTDPTAEPSVEPTEEPSDAPTAEPSPAEFSVESDGIIDYDGNMSVYYPVFSSDEHDAFSVNEFFRARALDAVAGYEAYVADFEQGDSPFTLDYNYSVEYARGAVASVLVSIEEYYGGVHEGLKYMAYTVSLEDGGSLVTIEDAFDDGLGAIRATVLAEVKSQLAGREHLYDDADAAAEELLNLSEYWYLSDEGLVVYYQNYDLGPYVAGPQFFTISYDILPLADEYAAGNE